MKNILHTLLFATTLITLFAITSTAQNTFPSSGAAGIGTTAPNASSLFEVKSTSKGILFPRMTQSQRNAIASPVEGLLIYQTDHTAGFYYYSGTGWTAVTPKKGWLLTGNSGTTPSTNFIGTTDAQPLEFKVNNAVSGYLDFNSALGNTGFGFQCLGSNAGGGNTAIGYQANYSNTTGYQNTAVGATALYSNTTGGYNVACGLGALFANTSGFNNTGVGQHALFSNTTGNSNTATGFNSLALNTTGSDNTAHGFKALDQNSTGVSNTAIGEQALYSNYDGYQNAALGNNALYSNTSGGYNSAVGVDALHANTTGFNNTAIGQRSLYANSTGGSNTATGMNCLYLNTTGSENVGNGYQALYSSITGWENTAIGYQALFSNTGSGNTANGSHTLYANTTGFSNEASGAYALYFNTTGTNNTGDGNNALYNNSTGDYNTGLGEEAYFIAGNLSNTTCVGYFSGAIASASNRIEIGNFNVNWIGGQVGWSTFSDGRIKDNVREDIPGLAFINKLRPVSYNINTHKENEMMYKGKQPEGDWDGKYDIEKTRFTGFIAQEVEQAAAESKYDFSGVVKPTNENDLYSLRYSDFVVPLVKAVQELAAQNDSLKTRITKLETAQSSTGSSTSPNSNDGFAKISFDGSSQMTLLGQNIPNPFDNSTLIPFRIPKDCHDASIMIVNSSSSEVVSVIPISCNEDHVSIDAGTLASGSYSYSLYVNGKMVDTKSMVIAK